MTISAFETSSSMMANCFLMPSSSISLIRNLEGIMGRTLRFHCFHFSVYSLGSCKLHKCPNVQVTQYPFPSIYPFRRTVAPITWAISFATLGFSAIHIFILQTDADEKTKIREKPLKTVNSKTKQIVRKRINL